MAGMAINDEGPPWAPYLTDRDREVIERGRYARDHPLGHRPCLVLVGLQRDVVGLDMPILDQIDQFPSGVGASAWKAVRALAPLVAGPRLLPPAGVSTPPPPG